MLNRQKFWAGVCRDAHNWIGRNPRAAKELVEEGPAVLSFDRFELLDVDVNDPDLALLVLDCAAALPHELERLDQLGRVGDRLRRARPQAEWPRSVERFCRCAK